MRKDHLILTGLLTVQLLLAGITWNTSRATPTPADRSRVFDLEADAVDAITIVGALPPVGGERPVVELARRDDRWVIASADDYPAKTERADDLVKSLVGLDVGDPIASNSANHSALNVDERGYDRKVTLDADGDTTTVIIGGGPRNSLHVRADGDDEVRVARGTGIQTIRADARSYIDNEYVNVDKASLTQVTVTNGQGTLTFSRNGERWALGELPIGADIDNGAVEAFVTNVSRMTLLTPVGKEPKAEYGLDDGAHVVLAYTPPATDADDEARPEPEFVEYYIGASADERSYYSQSSEGEFIVTVPKYGAEQIIEKKVDDFIPKPSGEAAPLPIPEP